MTTETKKLIGDSLMHTLLTCRKLHGSTDIYSRHLSKVTRTHNKN
ncbi:MAG: hypothetical protein H6Q19_1350 [Bacteroidetes bacterium]|nr:hypothetical protein [Bacteroidota bacterium]